MSTTPLIGFGLDSYWGIPSWDSDGHETGEEVVINDLTDTI